MKTIIKLIIGVIIGIGLVFAYIYLTDKIVCGIGYTEKGFEESNGKYITCPTQFIVKTRYIKFSPQHIHQIDY